MLEIPGEAVRNGGPEAPCDECQPCLAPHRSWETAPRAEGPSHVASVQAVEAASILRFLTEAEWRVVRQASRGLGGRYGPVQAPGPQGSSVPGQVGAHSEGIVMEETNKFLQSTMAARLHEIDEGFNNDEVAMVGDELERCMRSCGTIQGGQWLDVEVDTLAEWLEDFLPQAECMKQLAIGLSTGLSQAEGREA